jgi:hypothetical protein
VAAYCREYGPLSTARRDAGLGAGAEETDPKQRAYNEADDSLEDCVQRNARSLATEQDDASTLGKVVRSECSLQLSAKVDVQTKFFPSGQSSDSLYSMEGTGVEDEARTVIVKSRMAHCPPFTDSK